MAHLSPSTVFSPSIARQQLAAQKDWNYVDSWLSSKFFGKTPPPFERNPDTLKALLALASLNETADEERELLARTEAKALQQLQDKEEVNHNGDLLRMLETGLTSEGKTSLDVLAELSVELGQPVFDTEKMARKLIELQATTFDLEQVTERVGILEKNLRNELDMVLRMKEELDGKVYHAGDVVAKETVDYQRKAKLLAAKLPEIRNRLTALSGTKGEAKITVADVKQEEDRFRETMKKVKDLEAQVKSYHGLPQDTDLARLELEQLRVELRELTQQRDNMFEGLVERESPTRTRR